MSGSESYAWVRALSVGASLFVVATACGCAGVGAWCRDRALDLVDIVNLKGGYAPPGKGRRSGQPWALGAKVEATRYLGMPAGFLMGQPSYELFGRRSVYFKDGVAVGLGIWGMHLRSPDDDGTSAGLEVFRWFDNYFGPLNASAVVSEFDSKERERIPLPWHQRFRFGGEVWLLAFNFGLFVNPIELFDLLGGFVGLDLTEDDGLAWGTRLYPERKATEEKAAEAAAPPTPVR